MRMSAFIFTWFCATLVCAAESDPKPVLIDGHTYALVKFNSGLPDFKPLSRRLATETQFATILVPDSLGAVCVCYGRDQAGGLRFYVLNTRPDNSTSIVSVEVRATLQDTLLGVEDLRLLPSQAALFPLEFRIIRSQAVLIYRWALAKENPRIPGGLPAPRPSAISVGQPFPPCEVVLLEGGTRNLTATGGRVCVLNWWNTRCSPCIAEMPGLNALLRKYKGKVQFVAVAPDPTRTITTFLRSHAFEFVQTTVDTSTSAIFGYSYPRNIVLDGSGIVVFDRVGGGTETYKEIEAVLREQLSR